MEEICAAPILVRYHHFNYFVSLLESFEQIGYKLDSKVLPIFVYLTYYTTEIQHHFNLEHQRHIERELKLHRESGGVNHILILGGLVVNFCTGLGCIDGYLVVLVENVILIGDMVPCPIVTIQ